MKVLHDGLAPSDQEVSAIMAKPLPALDADTDVAEAYRVFLSGAPAIIVTRSKEGIGLITRADLIASWSKRNRGTGESGEEDGHAV
jgi:predicted transcriptional regulator